LETGERSIPADASGWAWELVNEDGFERSVIVEISGTAMSEDGHVGFERSLSS
jgi:hypothetical protein